MRFFGKLFFLSLLACCCVPPLFAETKGVVRAGDGRVFFTSRVDGSLRSGEDGLYLASHQKSLLRRISPVFRIKKNTFLRGVSNSQPARIPASSRLWIEDGVNYALPLPETTLMVSERVLSLGKGGILIRLIITNSGVNEAELDAGVLFSPAAELKRQKTNTVQGFRIFSAEQGACFSVSFFTGEEINEVPVFGRDRFFSEKDRPFPDGLQGWYSELEIPAGSVRVVWIRITAARDVDYLRKNGRISAAPDLSALQLNALAWWRGWLGERAYRFKDERIQRLYLDSLYRVRQDFALQATGGVLQRKGWAFLENGFFDLSAAILTRLSKKYTSSMNSVPRIEQAGYISLLLTHFIRSGGFKGSLVLAGRFLEKLSASPIPDGADPASASIAPAMANAFLDGSLLMHYARQRSRQERYSRLARRWVAYFRRVATAGGRGVAFAPEIRAGAFSARIIVRLHNGFPGRLLACGLTEGADEGWNGPKQRLAAISAGGGFAAGYPFLGRQFLRHVAAPGPFILRALGLAASFTGLPGETPFPERRIKSIQRQLVCLGRVSSTVQNCLPYKNATRLLRILPDKAGPERVRYLLRLAAIIERLRIQTSQSVQEYAQRFLALDTVAKLQRMAEGLLADKLNLVPVFTTPGIFSFSGAPAVFLRRLRYEIVATSDCSAGVKDGDGRYSVRLRYTGKRFQEGCYGVRLLFKARYKGVDFHFRHALVRRTRFPLGLKIAGATEDGFFLRLQNRTGSRFTAIRLVLSDGMSQDTLAHPPKPGGHTNLRVAIRPALEHGDYPGMVLAEVGGVRCSTNFIFRHARRVRFQRWTIRSGEVPYWKSPEHDDSKWESASSWKGLPGGRGVRWVRGTLPALPDRTARRRVLYLGPILSKGKVYLNMAPLEVKGLYATIPEGVLLASRKNVLAVRLSADCPRQGAEDTPQLLIYQQKKEE